MNRVLTGAVAFAIALLARPQLEAADFNRGDCNVDGAYNIADAIYLLNHLFVDDAPGLQCDDACDINDDGLIDLGDVIYQLNTGKMVGTPPVPPPHGSFVCGEDPTDDLLDCAVFGPCP